MNTTARPEIRTFKFCSPAPGVRLDKYLAQSVPDSTRAYLQKLIEQGYVTVNGKKTKASRGLCETDTIVVEFPPLPCVPLAEPIPLTVVYEDNDILVIDKPAGLTVHPAPGHSSHTLVNAILALCPSLAMSNDLIRPGIVHRLDKDTSGLIVIAKNDFAREYLAVQFKKHIVTKGYIVLVNGRLSPEQGMIEAPIGRDPNNRKRMAIVEVGKDSNTRYQVKEYLGRYTLIEVIPLTGRTHQIRVHLSAIGYPVVGDNIYGVKSTFLSRQFIHAYRLGFYLPSTDKYCEFVSSLPPDLKRTLELLTQNI